MYNSSTVQLIIVFTECTISDCFYLGKFLVLDTIFKIHHHKSNFDCITKTTMWKKKQKKKTSQSVHVYGTDPGNRADVGTDLVERFVHLSLILLVYTIVYSLSVHHYLFTSSSFISNYSFLHPFSNSIRILIPCCK